MNLNSLTNLTNRVAGGIVSGGGNSNPSHPNPYHLAAAAGISERFSPSHQQHLQQQDQIQQYQPQPQHQHQHQQADYSSQHQSHSITSPSSSARPRYSSSGSVDDFHSRESHPRPPAKFGSFSHSPHTLPSPSATTSSPSSPNLSRTNHSCHNSFISSSSSHHSLSTLPSVPLLSFSSSSSRSPSPQTPYSSLVAPTPTQSDEFDSHQQSGRTPPAFGKRTTNTTTFQPSSHSHSHYHSNHSNSSAIHSSSTSSSSSFSSFSSPRHRFDDDELPILLSPPSVRSSSHWSDRDELVRLTKRVLSRFGFRMPVLLKRLIYSFSSPSTTNQVSYFSASSHHKRSWLRVSCTVIFFVLAFIVFISYFAPIDWYESSESNNHLVQFKDKWQRFVGSGRTDPTANPIQSSLSSSVDSDSTPSWVDLNSEVDSYVDELLSQRACGESDLYCMLQFVPPHPITNRKRVYLVVTNAGFIDFTMNLICSADRVGESSRKENEEQQTDSENEEGSEGKGKDGGEGKEGDSRTDEVKNSYPHHRSRANWLVAAADRQSYEALVLRNVPVVLMNASTFSSPSLTSSSSSSSSSSSASSSSLPHISSSAAVWGDLTHININREKVPLILAILQLGVDVLLIDADMVILSELHPLWSNAEWHIDIQVMYDLPFGIDRPTPSNELSQCLDPSLLSSPLSSSSSSSSSSDPSDLCHHLFEMNGGFLLIASNSRTIHLYEQMYEWLKARPKQHDQDALRVALRQLWQNKKMSYIGDNGVAYPEEGQGLAHVEIAAADGSALSNPSSTFDSRLSVRYVDPILAPNGGLYLLEGRQMWLEESKKRGIEQPIVLHVNWIVGHSRKRNILKKNGMWMINSRAQCLELDGREEEQERKMRKKREKGEEGRTIELSAATSREVEAVDSMKNFEGRMGGIGGVAAGKALISHRYSSRPRITSSNSTALSLHKARVPIPFYTSSSSSHLSLSSSLSPSPTRSPSTPHLLIFLTPKPALSFLAGPKRVEADADGVGEAMGQEGMSEEEVKKWKKEATQQFRAQQMIWSCLHSLGAAAADVVVFSSDPLHAVWADQLSFDLVSHFPVNEYSTPKLHGMFELAEHLANIRNIPLLLYTNGDIMYGQDLIDTAAAIEAYEFKEVVAVGVRLNAQVDVLEDLSQQEKALIDQLWKELPNEQTQQTEEASTSSSSPSSSPSSSSSPPLAHFPSSFLDNVSLKLRLRSRPFRSDAVDYFLFSPSVWDYSEIPPFLIGRIAYDNWLLNWANNRKSTVVIDTSATITAVHLNHPHTNSHFQPHSMDNLRLAGQTSVRGKGKMEYCEWKTIRREHTGEIQVVRQRPENGHVMDLYDAAEDAYTLINQRPTLFIVTVDNAFVNVFKNWLQVFKQVRSASPSTGILVLSAGPDATAVAKQYGISVFELSTGEKAFTALNGQQTSYLQILALQSKALLLLLEFGYDLVQCKVDSVFLQDPFSIYTHTAVVFERDRKEKGEREREIGRRKGGEKKQQVITDAESGSYVSADGWTVGSDIDLIAIRYSISPSDPLSSIYNTPYNVSTNGLYLRSTPETLRMMKRISNQHSALVTRATIPKQVDLGDLYEEWYIQIELRENERLQFATVLIDQDSDSSTASPFMIVSAKTHYEYRSGVLVDAVGTIERLRSFGVWMNEKGKDWAIAGYKNVDDRLNNEEYESCGTSELCGHLSEEEIDLINDESTPDRSIALLPLHPSNAIQVNKWLNRASFLKIKHFILIADTEASMRYLLSLHHQNKFPVLYQNEAEPNRVNRAETEGDISFVVPHLTRRILQLLEKDYQVVLIDPESVWFDDPFSVLKNSFIERADDRPLSSTDPSRDKLVTASIHCDIQAYTARNNSIETGLIAIQPTPQAKEMWWKVHQCTRLVLQPNKNGKKGNKGQEEQHQAEQQSSSALSDSCFFRASERLRVAGRLSVCQIDPYYFPSSRTFFSSAVSPSSSSSSSPSSSSSSPYDSSGVWPIIAPGRYVDPNTGRIKEWSEDWQSQVRRMNGEPIPPPSQKRVGTGSKSQLHNSLCRSSSTSSSSHRELGFSLKIRVLTYTRSASLLRLLKSLNSCDYDGDLIELEVSVDRPPSQDEFSSVSSWIEVQHQRDEVLNVLNHFDWKHGEYNKVLQLRHQGLVGQWIEGWQPASDTQLLLVLEDDMEVSPLFYQWLKPAICTYYLDQYDPNLFGISLQPQHYIVGQSIKMNQANKMNEISSRVGNSHLYRYQLLGTWGLVLFPSHWQSFTRWYDEKSQQSSFQPCVPYLESSSWWLANPTRVWSQWFIRYVFERGWYGLYTNWSSGRALAINHREAGENFQHYQGPRNELITREFHMNERGGGGATTSGVGSAMSMWPKLSVTPLFDFHFNQVTVSPEVLAERQMLLTKKQWKRACFTMENMNNVNFQG